MRNQEMMDPIYWAPTPKFGGGWIAHKSSKAPPAPDYKAAAEATAAGNLEMAKYTTEANRVTQVDPWGQVTWSQEKPSGFDQSGYDHALNQYYTDLNDYNNKKQNGLISRNTKAPVMPDRKKFVTSGEGKWTQTTKLDPELQAALDSQIAVQRGRSEAAESLLGKVQGQLSQPLDTSSALAWQTNMPEYDAETIQRLQANLAAREADMSDPNNLVAWRNDMPEYNEDTVDRYSRAAFERQSALLNPQYQQQEERLRNQLALQGLSNTAEAFQTDVGNFSRNRNEAFNNLANQSLFTGRQIADSDYQRQFNEIQANNALRGQQFNELGQLYNTANQSLLTGRQVADANYGRGLNELQLNNTIRGQQLSELSQLYNMPLDQLNALLTGQQVQKPTFSNFYQQQQTAGPDYLSAANMGYQADLNAYNAKQASSSSLLGGLMGVAGSFVGGPAFGAMMGAGAKAAGTP